MIYTIAGFIVMFGILVGIGINQPRGTTTKNWCYLYLIITIIFDGLVILALINRHPELIELLLGLSAGAATGLAIHVTHHIFEEGEDKNHQTKEETK